MCIPTLFFWAAFSKTLYFSDARNICKFFWKSLTAIGNIKCWFWNRYLYLLRFEQMFVKKWKLSCLFISLFFSSEFQWQFFFEHNYGNTDLGPLHVRQNISTNIFEKLFSCFSKLLAPSLRQHFSIRSQSKLDNVKKNCTNIAVCLLPLYCLIWSLNSEINVGKKIVDFCLSNYFQSILKMQFQFAMCTICVKNRINLFL